MSDNYRSMKSWPESDSKKTPKDHSDGHTRVGDTCPICSEPVDGLVPTHIRNEHAGGSGE